MIDPSVSGGGSVDGSACASRSVLPIDDGSVSRSVRITSKPCSAASVRASSPWAKPRHCSVVMNTWVPTWFVMNPTSRSRRMGMSGFWIAPRRASATITTIVSRVVGSCQETIVPAADAARRQIGGDAFGGVAELRVR